MNRLMSYLFIVVAALITPEQLLADVAAQPPPLGPLPKLIKNPDPMLPQAWHLKATRALEAWSVSEGSDAMIVAVIDSGIRYNHPELRSNLWINRNEIPGNAHDDDHNGYVDDVFGWDFIRDAGLPFDDTSHGTSVAGAIAGLRENGMGAAGVCPRCKIMTLRFLNEHGRGDTDDVIRSLDYAVKNGAKVINLSFAAEGFDAELLKALKNAEANDVVVTVSSGNDGESLDKSDVYPAKYELPNLLTVTSLLMNLQYNPHSNWSAKYTHLAGPGEDVVAPYLDGFDLIDGTSIAAPIIAGAAALVRSIAPTLRAPEVKQILLKSSQKMAVLKDKTSSSGFIDIKAAADCAKDPAHLCVK